MGERVLTIMAWIVMVLRDIAALPWMSGLLAGMVLGILLVVSVVWPFLKRRADTALRTSQNHFAALASHYLITPTSVIQAAVSRLQEAEALQPGQRQRLYDSMELGERRLWITAQQLLTIHYLATREIKFTPETVNLVELVNAAITSTDAFAREHKVAVIFGGQPADSQALVRIDRRYTMQAITAVVDNAIKFSPEGSKVAIGIDGGPNGFTIAVRDSGPGVPPEILRHIGEQLGRGTSIYTFDFEGMGLGMFIARQVTELQNGILKVYSKPGQGTQVEMMFPA